MPELTWQRVLAVCHGVSFPLAAAFALPELGLWVTANAYTVGFTGAGIAACIGIVLLMMWSVKADCDVMDYVASDSEGLVNDWQHIAAVVDEQLARSSAHKTETGKGWK